MIEIIERGTKEITKCKMCGCKFSFEYGLDTQEEYVDNNRRCVVYVVCPQCTEKVAVRIKTNDMPFRFKEKALKQFGI